jgi:putative toxin-antitoxin system antitoxin component (TIGR02293 family)
VEREVIYKAIGESPTSLPRRKKTVRLNTVEGDRLIALIAVFEKALSLLEDDVTAAMEWMSLPVRGLDKLPEVMGVSEDGNTVKQKPLNWVFLPEQKMSRRTMAVY